jgi:hypothetical protein
MCKRAQIMVERAPVNPSCPDVSTAAGVSDGAHSTARGRFADSTRACGSMGVL